MAFITEEQRRQIEENAQQTALGQMTTTQNWRNQMSNAPSPDDWAQRVNEERRRYSLERALQFVHTTGGRPEDMEGIALRVENYIQFGSFDGTSK